MLITKYPSKYTEKETDCKNKAVLADPSCLTSARFIIYPLEHAQISHQDMDRV